MKTIIVSLTLSLFALVSSLQAADDNKAPAPKPAPMDAKAKTAPAAPVAATASVDSDCGCTDTFCKLPVRKVAMSPKAAALVTAK
jgi:hypothetical protein